MATTHTTWATPTSESSIITSGLDGLTNNSLALSADFDSSTNLDLYCDLSLELCYASAPSAGTKVAEIYLLPSIDGTNYAEGSSSLTPQQALLVAALESRNPSTSAVERLAAPGIPLPPGHMKFAVKNVSGQTLKDNTVAKALKIRPYQLQNA
jgi:hypothetical protein